MVVLQSTGASRYHNCCVDGDTSPENFGSTHVFFVLTGGFKGFIVHNLTRTSPHK
jgi:hypothetical protein